ncbi:MAG: hypothetical protein Q4P66_01090 [Actinomycetaceae bacterium]|nr:hypothetical protein [Actinomycetaceae bacterium]
MKRGIIVVHDGHESEDAQKDFLEPHTETIVSIKPMTSEDWYYQLGDAQKGLSEGDELHLMHLHYLGDAMNKIAHAIVECADQGIRLAIGGEFLDENGMVEASRALVKAENEAAHARLVHLQKVAKGRRNATPPKCILVPTNLLEEQAEKAAS